MSNKKFYPDGLDFSSSKKLTLSFLLEYYKYLNTWNTSASLVSMIVSSSDDLRKKEDPTSEYLGELEKITNFEWLDTGNFTDQNVLSINDFYYLIIKEVRDKKIDEVLNLKN